MASIISAGTSAGTAIAISGDTSGNLAFQTQAGANTITVPNGTGTMSVQGVSTNIVSATQQTLSGTSVTFSSIPSWVKRITVMINAATVSGSGNTLIQIGNGTAETTGYTALSVYTGAAVGQATSTAGFISVNGSSGNVMYGAFTLENLTGNTWVMRGQVMTTITNTMIFNNGLKTTSGALSVLTFTTTTGTDTLGGTINILYE
jgi:hypothetical protein